MTRWSDESYDRANPDAMWVRITTTALAKWKADMEYLQALFPTLTREELKDRLSKARKEYRETILGAWRSLFPTLKPGEVVPNEVEKLLEEERREAVQEEAQGSTERG